MTTVSSKRRVLAALLRSDHLGGWRARRAGIRPLRGGTVVGVYSASSLPVVGRLVQHALRDGWTPRLWCLDDPPQELAGHTVGVGPGPKYALISRLVDEAAPAPVAIVDDDVEFVHGSLAMLAGIARRCGLNVYQPAHTYDSVVSWRLTYRRPATVARATSFVEVGPISVLDARAVDRLLPLDESVPMAGGIDFAWARRFGHELRFGVVDAVTMRHLRPLGGTYRRERGFHALEEELARSGATDPTDLHRTSATWSALANHPPPQLAP